MLEPAKPTTATPAPIPAETPDYHWSYGLLFQAWLVLFLGVICFALAIYLLSFIPKS